MTVPRIICRLFGHWWLSPRALPGYRFCAFCPAEEPSLFDWFRKGNHPLDSDGTPIEAIMYLGPRCSDCGGDCLAHSWDEGHDRHTRYTCRSCGSKSAIYTSTWGHNTVFEVVHKTEGAP